MSLIKFNKLEKSTELNELEINDEQVDNIEDIKDFFDNLDYNKIKKINCERPY